MMIRGKKLEQFWQGEYFKRNIDYNMHIMYPVINEEVFHWFREDYINKMGNKLET